MDRSQEPNRAAETAELATYFSKFSAALTRLDEELARWKNYEADYQALKTTLLDLPKEISHPVMVPIGNLAFMPGKLIHTNEVLVMLGDNWFVDRSAVQAAEIVDRRMELVQENIEKLKSQEDEIRNKSGMAPGLLGGQEARDKLHHGHRCGHIREPSNEQGLPIVEITEPYFSDDEEEKAAKAKKAQGMRGSQKTLEELARDKAMLDRIAELERQDEGEEQERRLEAGEGDMEVDGKKEETTDVNMEEATDVKMEGDQILPGSQKTPEEQARDRAILDRIAELEREDEERERRREAGEDVTSDEETESDEYEEVEDDGESEDEFRPKALDSDEEYEEEVWEHSASEHDDEEEGIAQSQGSAGEAATQKKKKGVHFAEQMSKTKKFDAMSAPSQVRSATTAPPGSHPTPVAPATAAAKPKAKSPADLYNQMRAKQQSARAAGSDQIVNMANLEATFANMTAAAGGPSGLGNAPIFDTPAAEPEATTLKSALKPAPKKVSLFKQSRAQAETPVVVEKEVEPESAPASAPKKMSKFAQSRAAAAAAAVGVGVAAGTVQERTPVLVKSAVGGISDRVIERNVPAPSFKSAPGVFEVVERNVPAVIKEGVSPVPAPVPIITVKDVIENTFTKPLASIPLVDSASSGRRKTSLFRQQQQRSSMEPEPAVPGSNIVLSDEQVKEEEAISRSKATAPAVVSRSASSGMVVEREPPVVVKASAKSTKAKAKTEPTLRTIPAVESSQLKDTALLKGAVVERDTIEPVDEEELEEDMLMRQVVSEYQERRQAMIAQYGAFTRDDIEEMWEKQVVIPPGMIIPEAEVIGEYDEDQDDDDEEEEEEEVKPVVVDDRNVPPKKLSLFRASRLTGSLAKQAKE
ncbi:uri1, prefoldin-like chaperone [Linnemannia schmuckeri]|uniref:Uri1, prefoldin-like chaperone n=1 Tax=Linnemannia schmuckeri TaxID=64567 RepID=A0A9P5VB05_9FUNG|nr:uri1, prefoldin-like chaperone [Linnemannia schmuckeri]